MTDWFGENLHENQADVDEIFDQDNKAYPEYNGKKLTLSQIEDCIKLSRDKIS